MSRSMNVVPFVSIVALCVLGDDYATAYGVAVNKIKIIKNNVCFMGIDKIFN